MWGTCENAHAEWIFSLWPVGLWLQSALIFLEEVRCWKRKASIWFIYPVFFLSPHLVIFSLHFVFRLFKASFPFSPSVVFVSLVTSSLSQFPSCLPAFVQFFHFLSFCVSFPFCSCFSLYLFLPPLCLVFLSPVADAARQTGQLHCNAEFAITPCTASRYRWNRRHLPDRSPSHWCFLHCLLLPSSLPSSSPQEPPLTGCSRIIESSIDRMGNIDSLLFSILLLLSTTPLPSPLSSLVFASFSLFFSLRLLLSFCLPASCSFCDHKF